MDLHRRLRAEGQLRPAARQRRPERARGLRNWAFSWPANRRILYNRASADPQGKPWSEAKAYVYWDGAKWTGPDVPDFVATNAPSNGSGPFIMNPEGVSRLWARTMLADGPFPVHYEPFEAPVANPVFPKVRGNPVARVFGNDFGVFGDAAQFPIVATTYRLTEHFHYWTKNVHINAVLQPESFVELSPELAEEKGIQPGQMVRIWSHRGEVKAMAMVTKRLRPLTDRRQDGAHRRHPAALRLHRR